jgi:hypothetical protein
MARTKYIVGIYDFYLAWGGSDDDGGWYNCAILVRPSRTFCDKASAMHYAMRMDDTFLYLIQKAKSLPDDGIYKSKYLARVYKDTLPRFAYL